MERVLPRNRTEFAHFREEGMAFFSKEGKDGEAKEAGQGPPEKDCPSPHEG